MTEIEEAPAVLAGSLLRLGMLFATESGDMRIVWRAYGDAKNLVKYPLETLTTEERAKFKCLIGC